MNVGELIEGAFDSVAEREELIRTIVGGILVALILYGLIRVFGVRVR